MSPCIIRTCRFSTTGFATQYFELMTIENVPSVTSTTLIKERKIKTPYSTCNFISNFYQLDCPEGLYLTNICKLKSQKQVVDKIEPKADTGTTILK